MTVTARRLLVLLALGAACTPKIQEEYRIELVGALDQKYLAGATSAVLEVNDKVVATTKISPDSPFTVRGTGIDIATTPSATFRVKALDARNAVVAVGESPEIELDLSTPPTIRIFMQKVGSFGRTFDLDYPRRDMIAVAAPGLVAAGSKAKPITVAFFGLGRVTVPAAPPSGTDGGIPDGGAAPDAATTPDGGVTATEEKPSEVLQLYNPVTHLIDEAGLGGNPGGMPHPRVAAAATVDSSGRVLIFGGEVAVPNTTPAPSGQLDLVAVSRTDFDAFAPMLTFRESTAAGVPRVGSVLVYTDAAYAIGGRAGQALDTIAVIRGDNDFTLLSQRMAGPRERHTATVVNVTGGHEVLIFGGAGPNVPVAEILAAPGPTLVMPTGDAGVPRRDHAAVLLPGDRVLILGGRSDTGVLGDSVLYQANRTLSAGPITLKRPRAEFAAFIVGDDLVVAGGYDAAGALVNTAEVYSASTLAPRNLDVPAFPRSGASVVVLPNHLAVLMGGTQMETDPTKPQVLRASSVVETYQPFPKAP